MVARTTGRAERMARRGRLKANVTVLWKLMADKLYRQGDLPVLAVREAVQNSRDAVMSAVRRGQIGTGQIAITWADDEGGKTGTLTIADNGIGMDERTLDEKFFSLGESGKEGEEETLGGFGAAKAVILGASTNGKWSIATRSHIARSRAMVGHSIDDDYEIDDMLARQGTEITIGGVENAMKRGMFGGWAYPEARILALLQGSDLGSIEVYFNGARVQPGLPRRAGSHLKQFEDMEWGRETKASVRRYHRGALGGAGHVYVRLGGLLQFTNTVPGVDLEHDIVVDIDTKVKAKADDYPFNVSRDEFNPITPASRTYNALLEELSRAAQAGGKEVEEYTVVLPDAESPEGQEASREFGALMEEALGDLQNALAELSGLTSAYYEEQAPTAPPVAVGEGVAVSEMPQAVSETPDPYKGWRAVAREGAEAEGGPTLGQRVKDFVEVRLGFLPHTVEDVAAAVDAGQEPGAWQLEDVFDQIATAVTKPTSGAESIVAGAAAGVQLLGELAEVAPAWDKERLKRKAAEVNPFGRAAILKFSNVNYADPPKEGEDEEKTAQRRAKRRAARFRKKSKKYLPHLALWDYVVKLIGKEGGVTIPFGVGFVLDDSVRGLASQEGEWGTNLRRYVMINPEGLDEVIRAFKEHPYAIAVYLHSVASHELAHLPLLGSGHNNEWAKQREDLGASTAHLVQLFAEAVPRLIRGVKRPRRRRASVGAQAVQAADAAELERKQAEAETILHGYRQDVQTYMDAARQAEGEANVLRHQLATAQAAERAWKLAVQDRWLPIIHRLDALAEVETFLRWVKERPELLPAGVSPELLVSLVRGEPGSVLALVEAAAGFREQAAAVETFPVSRVVADEALEREVARATAQLHKAGFDVGSVAAEVGIDTDADADTDTAPYTGDAFGITDDAMPASWTEAVAEAW